MNHPDTPAEFVTVKEIADEANVHPQTVRRWIEMGELPGFRFGTGPQPPIRVRKTDWSKFKGDCEVSS